MINSSTKIEQTVYGSLKKLIQYIDSEQMKGYDPYDALNSKILKFLSFRNKWLRIAFTQFMRRFPVNLRPLLFIRKGHNPKALGLFLSGYVKLQAMQDERDYSDKIKDIVKLLGNLRSSGYSEYCWGYNFPWQSRMNYYPIGTPTVVNTSFIGHGFLDAYEVFGNDKYLEIAKSACQFILNDLRITHETQDELCFGYTPLDEGKVYNANILGASLLARVYSITQDENFLQPSKKMVKYVVSAQNSDGSWYYGAYRKQKWIDIHHTGFVLERLYECMKAADDTRYIEQLKKGLDFFQKHFFLPDGQPKLWHNRKYPADIHSVQAIITLTKLQSIIDSGELIEKLIMWIVDNLQDKKGYFYYQKKKCYTNKIFYMRWSQAWAFHALTTYLQYLKRL